MHCLFEIHHDSSMRELVPSTFAFHKNTSTMSFVTPTHGWKKLVSPKKNVEAFKVEVRKIYGH